MTANHMIRYVVAIVTIFMLHRTLMQVIPLSLVWMWTVTGLTMLGYVAASAYAFSKTRNKEIPRPSAVRARISEKLKSSVNQ